MTAKARKLESKSLKNVLLDGMVQAEETVVRDRKYLDFWEIKESATFRELLLFLLEQVEYGSDEILYFNTIEELIMRGSLATQMILSAGLRPTKASLSKLLDKTEECLLKNVLFFLHPQIQKSQTLN